MNHFEGKENLLGCQFVHVTMNYVFNYHQESALKQEIIAK